MSVAQIEGRPKPNDVKAEQAVLAAVLCSFDRDAQSKLMGELVQLLLPSQFYAPQHVPIWGAMLAMHADRRPIDVVTLRAVLASSDQLQKAGGVQYLAELLNGVPATAYPLEYARIIADHARVRRTISTLEAKAALGYALAEGQSADYLAAVERDIRDAVGEEKVADEWVFGAAIFEPLPPVPWVCKGLALGPGRPHTLVGFGYSGKTVAAQELGLAVASGFLVWNRFPTRRGIVLHLDHEVGRRGTLSRYQRLAFAHGITPDQIEDRLRVLPLPRIRLSDPGAEDWYVRQCTGATLCIIDSLRAAIAGDIDENDSTVRSYLDILLRVSDVTGCTFVVLHHSGKGRQEGDQREAGRGSSAIYDASGTVLKLDPQKHDERQVTISKVQATKMAAEASGGAMEPFWLRIEDVADDQGADERAGLRCAFLEEWEPTPASDDAASKPRKAVGHDLMMKATFAVETYVRANPGCTGIMIRQGVSGFGGDTIQAARDWLRNAGRLELRTAPGGRGSNRQCWYATKEEG